MWLIIYGYLRAALFLGHDEYVYNLGIHWGSDAFEGWRRCRAAFEVQKDLEGCGYFRCPSCFWVTKIQDEHIKAGQGWCYQQAALPPEQREESELAC